MRTIQKYFSIYREVLRVNIAEALSFRVQFIFLVLLDIVFYATTLASVSFIYDHVPIIGNWSEAHFLFFIGFILAIENIHMAVISESFWNFSVDIKNGGLDYALLRPAGTVFSVFFSRFRPGGIFTAPIPWCVMGYYGSQVGLSVIDWIMILPLVMAGLALLIAIEVLIAIPMFWVIDSVALNFVRLQLQSISRWPEFLYRQTFRAVFLFAVPVLLVSSAPVEFLFDSGQWRMLVGMIAALAVMCYAVRIAWHLGLKKYESASS